MKTKTLLETVRITILKTRLFSLAFLVGQVVIQECMEGWAHTAELVLGKAELGFQFRNSISSWPHRIYDNWTVMLCLINRTELWYSKSEYLLHQSYSQLVLHEI